MTFEAVCKYTEDSISQVRDFCNFVKKRQQIEMDYASALVKLSKSAKSLTLLGSSGQPSAGSNANSVNNLTSNWKNTIRSFANNSNATQQPESEDISIAGVASSVADSNLYLAIEDIRETMAKIANEHKAIAENLGSTIVEPLQKSAKEMELVRKQLVEDGQRINKELQDAYTHMKKMKQAYEEAQNQSNDAVLASQKAVTQTHSKGAKNIEKASNKAQSAQDKAQLAYDTFLLSENSSKICQEKYYSIEYPNLLNKFKQRELDRVTELHGMLMVYCDLIKRDAEDSLNHIEGLEERVRLADIDSDIKILAEDHMQDNNVNDDSIPVVSLMNPHKTGRIKYKRNFLDSSIKSKYCVLMAQERKLYIFDTEDSKKPKDIVNLSLSKCRPLHESLFPNGIASGSFGFQIISYHSLNQMNNLASLTSAGMGSVSNLSLDNTGGASKGVQTHYFILDSLKEKMDWFGTIRTLTRCCNSCSPTFEKQLQGSVPDSSDYHCDQFRIYRTLKIGILEAQNLPISEVLRRTTDAYCMISFDEAKVSKTIVKYGSLNPFWGEEIVLDDVTSCVRFLRITVFSKKTLTKDIELGFVELDLEELDRRDEWVKLKMTIDANNIESGVSSSSESDQMPGSIVSSSVRINVSVVNHYTLPNKDYNQELYEIYSKNIPVMCKQLIQLSNVNRDDLARTVVNYYIGIGREFELLNNLIQMEIFSTEDLNIIFRGNSIATKAIDYYMKIVGMSYLGVTMGDLVKQVYKSKEICEIDPTRVEKPDDLDKNFKRLMAWVNKFWDAIVLSLERIPMEMKYIFSCLAVSASKQFKEPDAKYLAVSGFLFLRFFCPAILNPKLFGMAAEHPDGPIGRTLTLVAKVVQNLANLVDFGKKEPHMLPFNPFIKKNINLMKAIIEKMSTLPQGPIILSNAKSQLDSLLSKDMGTITNHLLLEMVGDKEEADLKTDDELVNLYKALFTVKTKLQSVGAWEIMQKRLKARQSNTSSMGGDGSKSVSTQFHRKSSVFQQSPSTQSITSVAEGRIKTSFSNSDKRFSDIPENTGVMFPTPDTVKKRTSSSVSSRSNRALPPLPVQGIKEGANTMSTDNFYFAESSESPTIPEAMEKTASGSNRKPNSSVAKDQFPPTKELEESEEISFMDALNAPFLEKDMIQRNDSHGKIMETPNSISTSANYGFARARAESNGSSIASTLDYYTVMNDTADESTGPSQKATKSKLGQ